MTIIPAVTRSISAAVAVALLVAACATASPTASPSISASGTAASRTAGPTRAATGPPASGPTPAATPGDTPGIVTPQPATPSPRPSRTPASTAHPSVVPSPSPAVTPAPTVAPTSAPPIAGLDEVLGSDGRFTVLVLGSDARPGLIGRRTDTIMVLTISPADGVVAAVSLPRDMEGVPTGPGRVYGAKVTGLYQSFTASGSTNAEAAEQTREALAYAFGTEIDRYVFIGFEGLTRLVDAVGGVDVTLARPLDDTFILVDGKRGFHLKKGVNHLTGKTALLFARTRHADNDYERTRRQQQLIVAAAKAVRDRGAADLPALLSLAMDQVETDIPFTSMPALFELLGRADLGAPRGAVLGPNQYAGAGRARYSIVMRVAAVRTLFDRWFGPVTQP